MSSSKEGKPMMRRRVTSALFAVFCAILTMALSTVVALADSEGNMLTVGLSEQTHVQDITSKENLVVDVYKVASATYDAETDTYNYTMVDTFASLQNSLDKALAGSYDWKQLYDSTAALAKNATPTVKGHVIAGNGASSINLPEDGLYLVLARGASQDVGSNVAVGTKNRYAFQPTMVAMPTKYDKNGNMSGAIGTDPSYGEWRHEATILLKYALTTIPTPPPPTPKTGDQNDLMPLYIIMAVSGTLFAALAVSGIRNRRSEDK